MSWNKVNRSTHYWGSILCAIPLLIIIVTGILLLLKKEFTWIQPKSQKGSKYSLKVDFPQILAEVKKIKESKITSWKDIKLLDVRPKKGIVKIRAKNNWEIQIDTGTGKVLQIAYRRSDLIESLHDGSFFHDKVKLAVFLPCGIILLLLWITGMYIFIRSEWYKYKRKRKKNAQKKLQNS